RAPSGPRRAAMTSTDTAESARAELIAAALQYTACYTRVRSGDALPELLWLRERALEAAAVTYAGLPPTAPARCTVCGQLSPGSAIHAECEVYEVWRAERAPGTRGGAPGPAPPPGAPAAPRPPPGGYSAAQPTTATRPPRAGGHPAQSRGRT